MEKLKQPEEVKGLEEEIDSTIDRLFVEKEEWVEGGPREALAETPVMKIESPATRNDQDPRSGFVPFSKSMEKLEAQLLSLEWDVTVEHLLRIKGEINAIQSILKEEPQIRSILNSMEDLLDVMIKNSENILPSYLKLLLDSGETIKLLTESDGVAKRYHRLAYEGIQARFFCVKEWKDSPLISLSLNPPPREGKDTPVLEWKTVEGMLHHFNSLCEKLGAALEKVDQRLSLMAQGDTKPSGQGTPTPPVLSNITVFQIDEKWFGVPSDKIVKLFKVPDHWYGHFSNHQRIRLKDLEVKIVDLKKIFSFPEGGGKREIRILTVKTDGEFKGFIIERVLKGFSAYVETKNNYGEYFGGMVRWNYQDHPVEVPILDLTRF